MEITYKTPTLLVISITDLLARNGKNFSEITDVLYLLKINGTDTDEAAKLTKDIKTPLGITKNNNDETIDITISDTDFGSGKLIAEKEYLICFSVEFNNSGYYIEDYDPKLTRKLKILRDKIRR